MHVDYIVNEGKKTTVTYQLKK